MRFLSAIGLMLLLSSCASIDRTDYRQTVLVRSHPSGAIILDQNGNKLGVTPAYVRVRRGSEPEVSAQLDGQNLQSQKLQSHYRWMDSFFSNFIFIGFAPVGWLVDRWTGTAWQLDDPKEFDFNVKASPKPTAETVAVVPFAATPEEMSTPLAGLVEQRLRAEKYSVLPYAETAPLFMYYSSVDRLSDDKAKRYNLLYQLKSNRVLTSRALATADGYLITSDLLNVYTGAVERSYSWNVSAIDATSKLGLGESTFRSYFYLLPNTIFLNSASASSNLTVDGRDYAGKAVNGDQFTDQVLKYFGAISLSRLRNPKADGGAHFVFNFLPGFSLSKRRYQYTGCPTTFKDVEFERWHASGGYGIELGHQSWVGLFYFDAIPMLAWTQLTYSSPQGSQTLSGTSVTVDVEIGYSRFLSDQWVGKLYSRGLTEDSALWQRSIRSYTHQSNFVDSISSNVVGVAIGYVIPSSLRTRKESWRIQPTRSEPAHSEQARTQ